LLEEVSEIASLYFSIQPNNEDITSMMQ